MKIIHIAYIILFVLLFNCKSEESLMKSNITNIKFNNISDEKSDSLRIKSIKYIFLEQTPNCIIGNIHKILYNNGRFFVFDRNFQTVFVFNENGNFIFKIHKPGKGPGEYIQPNDFDIDQQGNIYILDLVKPKIIKYSNDGSIYKEISIGERSFEFAYLSDTKFIQQYIYGKKKIINLAENNVEHNNLNILINNDAAGNDNEISFLSPYYLFRSDSVIYYNPRFTNQIYRITKSDFYEAYRYDSLLIPSTTFIKNLKIKPLISYQNESFISDVRYIFENSNVFYSYFQKKIGYHVVISKKTKKQIIFKNWRFDNYVGNGSIIGIANNYFISLLTKPTNKEIKWNEIVENLKIDNEIKKKILNLKSDSNPVLVLFEFNEF